MPNTDKWQAVIDSYNPVCASKHSYSTIKYQAGCNSCLVDSFCYLYWSQALRLGMFAFFIHFQEFWLKKNYGRNTLPNALLLFSIWLIYIFHLIIYSMRDSHSSQYPSNIYANLQLNLYLLAPYHLQSIHSSSVLCLSFPRHNDGSGPLYSEVIKYGSHHHEY